MRRSLWLLLLAGLLLAVRAQPLCAQDRPVVVLEIAGVINPLTTRYLERGLRIARDRDAQLVVIELDTPGGLESAMRDMVQLLLDARLPTAVYVSPGGARATSAGLFILLAGDIAAMAPATHVGAAHPVPLGGESGDVMDEKVVSDAAALVRTIATTRGRNAAWAEQAVRDNLSVTAEEALDLDVIDLVAGDLADLMRQVDGQNVGDFQLETADADVEEQPMNVVERLFHIITDPNIAYLLLSLGTLFLLVELADPGLSVAGVGAAVAFVIAFLGLGNLPVNWAAVALLGVSVVLFVVGLLTETEVVVSIAALVPFVLGSLLLFTPLTPTSPSLPSVRVSPWLIGLVGASIVGFTLVVLRAMLVASKLPPRSGAQRLVGYTGVALTDLDPTGQVRVDLQDWSAVSMVGPILAGMPVRVTGIRGVRLEVVPDDEPVEEAVTPPQDEAVHP